MWAVCVLGGGGKEEEGIFYDLTIMVSKMFPPDSRLFSLHFQEAHLPPTYVHPWRP